MRSALEQIRQSSTAETCLSKLHLLETSRAISKQIRTLSPKQTHIYICLAGHINDKRYQNASLFVSCCRDLLFHIAMCKELFFCLYRRVRIRLCISTPRNRIRIRTFERSVTLKCSFLNSRKFFYFSPWRTLAHSLVRDVPRRQISRRHVA